MKNENIMLNEILQLPKKMTSELEFLSKKVSGLYKENDINSLRLIIITGCGDSIFAGQASELAFQQFTEIVCKPMSSMEFSRYASASLRSFERKSILVIGISTSGNTVRTCEAINVAHDMGFQTLAITSNPDSHMASMANNSIIYSKPVNPWEPQVMTYRSSLLALYLTAIRIAEIKSNSPSNVDNYYKQLQDAVRKISHTIKLSQDDAKKLTKELLKHKNYLFLSHGPNLGTAKFGAAKIIEATGLHAYSTETEEWAHLEYFVNIDIDTPTFLISPPGPGHSRANEILEPLKRVGRSVVLISSEDEAVISPKVLLKLNVAEGIYEHFSPLVYAIPIELYSAYLYKELNVSTFCVGIEAYENGSNTIRESKMLNYEDILELMKQT